MLAFFKRFRSDCGIDPLVALVRVAQQDPKIMTWLTGLLSLDNFNRKSLINTLLQQWQLQQFPGDFVAALEILLEITYSDTI